MEILALRLLDLDLNLGARLLFLILILFSDFAILILVGLMLNLRPPFMEEGSNSGGIRIVVRP